MATSGGKRPARRVNPVASTDAATSIPAALANPATLAQPTVPPVVPAVVTDAAPVPTSVFVPPAPVAAPIADVVAEAAAAIEPVTDTIDSLQTAKEDMTMDATTATNTAAEKTQAMFADVNDRTKGAVEKSTKFFQDVTEFGKGNVEALVESSKIATKGFESMGQDAAAYAKTSFESASEALRTLASIKSPTEFLKFQSDYVRSVFDGLVAQTSRGTEASLKLVGEIAQPISNRVAVAADKIKVGA